jgi:eukaryotic-like serine/threonine-protein kinase
LRRVRFALVLAGLFLVVATAAGAETKPLVPNVVGKPLAAAVRAIVEAGYYADTSPVKKRSVDRGTVVLQDPRPRASLKKGKAVRLAIAIGSADQPTVKIPNLVGQSASAARARLVKLQLMMATRFRTGGRRSVGKVIAQNLRPGLVFQRFTQVTLLVGR